MNTEQILIERTKKELNEAQEELRETKVLLSEQDE